MGNIAATPAALDALLHFGTVMLRAGNTAARTSSCVRRLAQDAHAGKIELLITADALALTVEGPVGPLTAIRETGPLLIHAERIRRLERLATATAAEPMQLRERVSEIAAEGPLFSAPHLIAALAAASGAFAFLNGGGAPELIAAALSGGAGQAMRTRLARSLPPFAVATLCAVMAAGLYAILASLAEGAGIPFLRFPAGFIASVLFLVPGFPLVSGLFDLVNGQTLPGLVRLAHGMMVLLVVGFGLCLVIALGGIDITAQPPPQFATASLLASRALASFIAACAFAMLFNNAPTNVLAVGLVALSANSLRLLLQDTGLMVAAAALVGATTIGVVALVMDFRWRMPPAAVAAPAIIIMVPGRSAFETLVLFARGQTLEALQPLTSCAFVFGALAMGLAAARCVGLILPAE